MGPLLLTALATLYLVLVTMTVAHGAWAYRMPCAAIGLWTSAVLALPISALAAPLILCVDPHTRIAGNLVPVTFAGAASLLLLAVSWRVGTHFHRLNRAGRQRRRRHETLIDLFATSRPDLGDVDVIADDRPFAYSVPCVTSGRIVLSQGAIRSLGEEALNAVLAHERAHLLARHHLILQLAAALSAAFPRWTSAAAMPVRITELVEMAADCYARRRVGRVPTIAALAALADMPIPAAVMPAGGRAVALRIAHLRQQPRCCESARSRGIFALSVVVLAVPPIVGCVNQVVDLCLWGSVL